LFDVVVDVVGLGLDGPDGDVVVDVVVELVVDPPHFLAGVVDGVG